MGEKASLAVQNGTGRDAFELDDNTDGVGLVELSGAIKWFDVAKGFAANGYGAHSLGGYSLLAGGCTLACMVLPLFIRGCEQALRDCPQSYRLAAAGLAISRVGYLRRILLPFAAPGIAAALVLSAGRALAETAVLLFTAGYVMRWPESLFDSGRTLAVHIYDLAMNVSGGSPASAATALVLLGFALVIQLLVWRIGKRPLSFAR